ncbi:MAG: hypothetical protein AB1646_00630 [Thermodesulfobacteriota bacterium]
MEYILLGGTILNSFGGAIIIGLFARLSPQQRAEPPDYAQYRLFTAGAAFAFAAIYLYLFLHPEYAMPFLVFGMCLKFWAFVVSLFAYICYALPARDFISFGLSNFVFAVLFAVYLLYPFRPA